MSKKNLIALAIISLTIFSAGAVFGQITRQKARSLKPPNSATRTKPSVLDPTFDRFIPEDKDTPPVNNVKGNAKRKNIPGGNNLTKTGAGTLGVLGNKNPELTRSRNPRGRTGSGIIMANTEGDFHLKAKTRRLK
jgi:hypothetical protein